MVKLIVELNMCKNDRKFTVVLKIRQNSKNLSKKCIGLKFHLYNVIKGEYENFIHSQLKMQIQRWYEQITENFKIKLKIRCNVEWN